MNKLYTLPISVHAVDKFFRASVQITEDEARIKNIKDSYIFLYVLFQDYVRINSFSFRGSLTDIDMQRGFEVIEDLDVFLPKETPESLEKIRKRLAEFFEKNKYQKLDVEAFDELLPKLRDEAEFWSDDGFAEFFNHAFEYELCISLADLDTLKKSLGQVAHNDPQADYDDILRQKRETDIELDTDIHYRSIHNGKNDPAGLLLKDKGAGIFEDFKSLTKTENKLLEFIHRRRFPRSGLLQNTDTKSLGKEFAKEPNNINALKWKIDNKVNDSLGRKLFITDKKGNITFPHSFTCMSRAEREKQQNKQRF